MANGPGVFQVEQSQGQAGRGCVPGPFGLSVERPRQHAVCGQVRHSGVSGVGHPGPPHRGKGRRDRENGVNPSYSSCSAEWKTVYAEAQKC